MSPLLAGLEYVPGGGFLCLGGVFAGFIGEHNEARAARRRYLRFIVVIYLLYMPGSSAAYMVVEELVFI